MNKKAWLLAVPVLMIAVLGVVLNGARSRQPQTFGMVSEPAAKSSVTPSPGTSEQQPEAAPETASPPAAQPIAPLKTTPKGGSRELYPEPGDPNYADYQEMLRQPEYDLSVANSPGDRLPYDPEWRSLRTGRRVVAAHDRAFTAGGSASLDELAQDYIFGLNQVDEPVIRDLQITKPDFLDILWPEFPQSRPAVHIPGEESWFFTAAKQDEGMNKTVGLCKGRRLKLEGARVKRVQEFTNFRILEVEINAQDETTGETITITGDKGATVAERLGRYKFYLYRN